MYARVELVPTTDERAEWYFEGIYEGDSRYESPSSGPTDTEGPSSGCSDTKGSDQEGHSGSPVRHRRVRFSLPKQPQIGGDSRVGIDGNPEVR